MKKTSAYEKKTATYVSDLSNPGLVAAMIETQASNTLAAAKVHGNVTADIRHNAQMVRPLFEKNGLDDSIVDYLLDNANEQFRVLNESAVLDDKVKVTYWSTYLATTGREFKDQGMVLKYSGKQVQKLEKGQARFDGVTLEWKKQPAKRTARATSKESNTGGDTKPGIKTADEVRAQMAAWVRQGVITETQLFDSAVSLFEKETELAAAFKSSGFLTKQQTAVKVSAAVTKERKVNYKAFEAEKAKLKARAENAVQSAAEIKARA